MGPKSKAKGPGKTPPSTRDNSVPRMADLDGMTKTLQGDTHLDYKQLALEVAKYISPDIQESLAMTVTNTLTKIQNEVSQHEIG